MKRCIIHTSPALMAVFSMASVVLITCLSVGHRDARLTEASDEAASKIFGGQISNFRFCKVPWYCSLPTKACIQYTSVQCDVSPEVTNGEITNPLDCVPHPSLQCQTGLGERRVCAIWRWDCWFDYSAGFCKL